MQAPLRAAPHAAPVYLPPRAARRARATARRRGREYVPLDRRGRHLGWALATPARSPEAAEIAARWAACRPIQLPGAVRAELPRHARALRATLALFERLRRGASFQDALWERAGGDARFAPAGAVSDLGDPREIEKVFAHGGGRARDLYAKLSWIAHDERDASLRVRFSFGAEQLLEWRGDARRAPWSDRFAEVVFPECRAITEAARLVALVRGLTGRTVRFSERIVYSNAPGGGAVFHSDAEPRQLGVLFAQLAGETAWLALPETELARTAVDWLAEHRPRSALRRRLCDARRARAAFGMLADRDDPELRALLDREPRFARALIERGAFFRLQAGDALLLPNRGERDTCWHSVFALGGRASLAHSYGIFPRVAQRAVGDRAQRGGGASSATSTR